MKSFAITGQQLTRLACALTGDELSRHHNNYKDFLTRAAWAAETKLGKGGLDLSETEIGACARRICTFFDKPPDTLQPEEGDTFGDWAARLEPAVSQSVQTFKFHPATQAGSAEMRHPADEIWQDARVIASLMHGRRPGHHHGLAAYADRFCLHRACAKSATAGSAGWPGHVT